MPVLSGSPALFPKTAMFAIRDRNALPNLIISSAEGAEDGMARFTSFGES